MKKIFILSLLLLCAFCVFPHQAFAAEEEFFTYVVAANSAKVFEEPDFSSNEVEVLSHGEKVDVFCVKDAPVSEICEGFAFYKVKISDDEAGFVLADLLVKDAQYIQTIPTFNAKTNSSCRVYSQKSADAATEIKLSKGTQIFLYEGYDSKNEFTAVSFVLDGEVLYAYLLTENISPNGINPMLITCAVLIVAVLGIIFTWLFMRNRKINSAVRKSKLKSSYNLKSGKFE